MNVAFQVFVLPWLVMTMVAIVGNLVMMCVGEMSPLVYTVTGGIVLWIIVISFALAGQCPQVGSDGVGTSREEGLDQLPCASFKVVISILIGMGLMTSMYFNFSWSYVFLLGILIVLMLMHVKYCNMYTHKRNVDNTCECNDFALLESKLIVVGETPSIVVPDDRVYHFGSKVNPCVLAMVPPNIPHSGKSLSTEI